MYYPTVIKYMMIVLLPTIRNYGYVDDSSHNTHELYWVQEILYEI